MGKPLLQTDVSRRWPYTTGKYPLAPQGAPYSRSWWHTIDPGLFMPCWRGLFR